MNCKETVILFIKGVNRKSKNVKCNKSHSKCQSGETSRSFQIEFHLPVYFEGNDATVSVSLHSELDYSLRHMGAPIYISQTL